MSRKATRELVPCRFFNWRIWQNDYGVWYADGRSNPVNVGRHSLESKKKKDALRALHQLDAAMAVKHGLADESILAEADRRLPLEAGIEAYLAHVGRPQVAGGAKPTTVKRYQAVFDKFQTFAAEQGVEAWDEVSTRLLEGYAGWLEGRGYKYRTLYLELTTLKQAVWWLREEELLLSKTRIRLDLKKPGGSPTYCFADKEVQAMLRHCSGHRDLRWLGELLAVLAFTGMRIGEAIQLRWQDVDLDAGFLHIRDESRGGSAVDEDHVRTTKSGHSRAIPLHRSLYALFEQMPGPRKGPVFRGPRGGRAKPDTIRNILIREVIQPVAQKLYPRQPHHPFRRGRLHSFRHFFCTQCYRAGLSEREILDLMGHSDSGITQLYRHLAPGEYQKAINRLPDFEGDPASVA